MKRTRAILKMTMWTIFSLLFAFAGATAAPFHLEANQSQFLRHTKCGNQVSTIGRNIYGAFFLREEPEGPEGPERNVWHIINLASDGGWSSMASNQHLPDSDPPIEFTNQQGIWERTGYLAIKAKVLNFVHGENGEHTGNSIAIYRLKFSGDFNNLSGEYSGKEFPPDQNPLDPENPNDYIPFGGKLEGERVTVGCW